MFDKKDRKWIVLFVLGCLLGLYSTFGEPRMLRVVEWTVETQKWMDEEPLKIALLSDTHAIWPWTTPKHVEKIVARINALDPDLVLLLGDYVGTHPFGMQLEPTEGVAPFKKLSAYCGVYAVLGNHDFDDRADWPAALIKTGIPVLQNDVRHIDCDDRKFWIAGLKDLWKQDANIWTALNKVTNDDPVIMMMHNPDVFAWMPDSVILSVAGHMHGGQVRLPFIGAVEFVLPSKFGKRFLYGHIVEEGKDLVVTSGVGMTGIPVRFMNPPEIALVTLQRKP